ncbi:MAG: hypothetical protein ACOVNV_05015 [Pirellulaceae bacterium]
MQHQAQQHGRSAQCIQVVASGRRLSRDGGRWIGHAELAFHREDDFSVPEHPTQGDRLVVCFRKAWRRIDRTRGPMAVSVVHGGGATGDWELS